MLQSIQKTCLTKISCWLLAYLFSISLTAQQLPTFTQYRDLLTIINPGAIPIDYFVYDEEFTTFLGLTWREQWLGNNIEGAPSTKIIRADYFATDIGSGGILIYAKVAGVIELRNSDELSLGLTIGGVLNNLESRPIGAIDNFTRAFTDVGFGIFYRKEFQHQGFFYTGFSVPQVVGGRTAVEINQEELSVKRIQHYYYTFGLLHYFTDDSFIEPSIWMKYAPYAPVDIDINIRCQLVNRLSIGAGFSIQSKNLHLTLAFLQKWEGGLLKIGAGYNPSLTSYGSKLGASLEGDLNYSF